ncbi:MAG: hybrid sensor histidine kinase/response regulator [Melioribacteraceae bacterium]|nr:hybrid sensor histidine kinase/response regulator [Melioribacteraceae bacterium]MCF8354006.1 hybrid sensor histidine kinase/response regulator [Melioribacteraceae bacterium]MCF8392313.1 hybrid sensor histidine kinase/response regulator [Melioribacteraceae bacterium]MCF8417645.1 hybrid sensor histidine kinase/response regulator [Melioribacteraceae bacterium]
MLDLFKAELETNTQVLNEGLLKLEKNPEQINEIEPLMRASHSIKGAARILNLDNFVHLAHAMEDYFIAVQESKLKMVTAAIDKMFEAIDIFNLCSQQEDKEIPNWLDQNENQLNKLAEEIRDLITGENKSEVKEKPPKENKKQVEKVKPVKKQKVESGEIKGLDSAMINLFKIELEDQLQVLNKGLLILETEPSAAQEYEELMRAAHSLKGAARILELEDVVKVAHLMEDYFVGVQEDKFNLKTSHVDVLLKAVDLFTEVSKQEDSQLSSWINKNSSKFDQVSLQLLDLFEKDKTVKKKEEDKKEKKKEKARFTGKLKDKDDEQDSERILRVSAENLNRLVGLASESLVASRNLQNYLENFTRFKFTQAELSKTYEKIHDGLENIELNERTSDSFNMLQQQILHIRKNFAELSSELEIFSSRSSNLSNRLYREVLLSRMRPFEDSVSDFPRMVRDIAKQLNKKVQFILEGKNTKVDRDILEKLKAPLTHLVRNAVDHGIETIDTRLKNNKPEEGTVKLSASHQSGMLFIQLKDDGAGINFDKLRKKVVAKKYVTLDMAKELTDNELTDFLFLPGFSTSENVTEISGRGVGLDVVQNMLQEVGGIIRVESEKGKNTVFSMQLPITLSVMRTLIVRIGDEPYAFPLTRIDHSLLLHRSDIKSIESKQFFEIDGENIGLVNASQILGKGKDHKPGRELMVIVVSDRTGKYGLVVDEFVGERDLVVHRLDSRLGKIKDISAASILDNGDPVLIFDVDDVVRSIEEIVSGGRLRKISTFEDEESKEDRKRILVVDDSITVREVERKLLEGKGYLVDVAINGMDGWNSVRSNYYDLVISDIDMPRMNGFEFVTLIRKNEKTKNIPVVIVSYKDREEDKLRGLEVGANYYLTKSSFHDDTLINAVQELIGDPDR